MALISLHDIYHTYGDTDHSVSAVHGVSLEIEAGEFVAIVGPSGSGKTTLLNIIGTLIRPTKGRYIFDDKDVASLSVFQLAQMRAAQIGFVFQNFNLIDHLTVYDNIKLGLRYCRDRQKSGERDRIVAIMDQVGLSHRANHLPHQLSGGQQQRCAIARAIVGDPQVILADEPTGSLDSKNAAQVVSILKELNTKGTALIMVTHSMIQADRASRVLEMHEGRIPISSRWQ
jgi:putative ABC transport system ATP-binding protein